MIEGSQYYVKGRCWRSIRGTKTSPDRVCSNAGALYEMFRLIPNTVSTMSVTVSVCDSCKKLLERAGYTLRKV